MNDIKRIDTADVAKLIRQDLKAVFGKAVKFSVRSSRYSGGSSIRVAWTDGPTQQMVERIVRGYAGGGFDGMTDYKYRFDSFLDGERVRFGVDFVFAERRISYDVRARAAASLGYELAGENIEREINELSIDEMQQIMRNAMKRCDSRIAELFARNFTGPRAIADVEQAENERLAVYPSAERLEGRVTGSQKADDVQRFDNASDALAAARAGQRINVLDLVPKQQRRQ